MNRKKYDRLISFVLILSMLISGMAIDGNISIEAAENTEISIDLTNGLANAVYKGTTEACTYSADLGYGYTENASDLADWNGVKDTASSITNGVFYISKGGTYRITTSGNSIMGNIVIKSDEEVTLILDNVNITGSKSIYRTSPYENTGYYPANLGLAPIDIQGNTVCNLILEEGTENTIQGTNHGARLRNTAAISVENLHIQNSSGELIYDALATLVIDGEGTLNATGVECTSAIGGNDNRLTGNIIINGGTINATSGNWGAAIGDGDTIDSSNGAQYISKWYCQDFTQNGVEYKKNVHQARIQINGGYVNAVATTATPAIGTSDQLSEASGYTGKEWDGMIIDIEGGTIVAIGGGRYDTSAIGAGNKTKLNPANIIINQNGNTKILALTQQGGYPIIADSYTTGAMPAISGESSATVLNLKFNQASAAKDVEFWPLIDGEYIEDGEIFPNNILSTLDVSTYGISVVLSSNSYILNKDGNETEIEIPETGGMIDGSEENGEIVFKYPPTVTNPTSVVVTMGDGAAATYQVTGTAVEGGTLAFQWQVSKDNGMSWANISSSDYTTSLNGTTSTLTVNVGNSEEKDGYQYRCELSETISSSDIRYATSDAATLAITGETLYDITVSVFLNDSLWTDNELSINLYKNGALYASATSSFNKAIFAAEVPAGTYEVYVGHESTGLYTTVSQMAPSGIARVYYYEVNLVLEGMGASDSVAVGATSYTANGTYGIIAMNGKTITAYARSTNVTNSDGTYYKSDIYSVNDASYSLSDSDISTLLSDKGYTFGTVNGEKTITIVYKKQHKAEINVYIDPTSSSINTGYLWTDYNSIGAYNKSLTLRRSADNKEYTLNKQSGGVYRTDDWVFEGDTLDIYVNGADTNVDISVSATSQLGILRYYTLTYNTTGGNGTGLPGKTAYLQNSQAPITNVIPTMDRYSFAGWTEDFLTNISGNSITMNNTKTLYATWELARPEGSGVWKEISGTSLLEVKFNDEINLNGKVYIYDDPELTNTYYITGSSGKYIDIEGDAEYYKYDSIVSIHSYGMRDTSEMLVNGENIEGTFETKTVNSAGTEYMRITSADTFTVTHSTTYYLLKVQGKNDNGEVVATTYLPIKIEAEVGKVEVRAFQMNTNTAEGAVSEFNPSFRIVSRVGKVMADKNGQLRTVSKFGTVYALDSLVNSDYNGLMKTEELGDNTGDVRHFEADDIGILKDWSGSLSDTDKENYNYYALTFMSTNYFLDWLNTEYALTAYAVLDNGEIVYDANDVQKVSIYSIAKNLYDNKKMSTQASHEYLYDNILNIVAIKGNEKAIANAVRAALGGGGAGTTAYTYANNLYRDLYYYIRLSGNYNYEKYSLRGAFTSNSMVGNESNESLLLDALNQIYDNEYDSVIQWIGDNTDYLYEENPWNIENSSVNGAYE